MRGLTDERGATGILFGIFIVVFLGMAAIAVDIGKLYQERRELQNGADAGALAIAEDCARSVLNCAASGVEETLTQGTASEYADANAGDQASHVEDLDLDPVAGEITIDLLSEDAQNKDKVVYHWFAPVIGHTASEVRASATARWGPAIAAEGFPFGVCEEVWDDPLHRPDETGPGETLEIRYKGTGRGNNPVKNECLEDDDDFDPGNVPGNFSWLDQHDNECTAEFDFSEGSTTATGDPGNDVPSNCRDEVDEMADQIEEHINTHAGHGHPKQVHDDPADNNLPIRILPIYSTVSEQGNSAEYELVTLGAFEFSGMHMKAQQNIVVEEWSDPLCKGESADHFCVRGRFVREVGFGDIEQGANSDVMVVRLID